MFDFNPPPTTLHTKSHTLNTKSHILHSMYQSLCPYIRDQLSSCLYDVKQMVREVVLSSEREKQRLISCYEEERFQMKRQISRQHTVIQRMKKQVEDLLGLMEQSKQTLLPNQLETIEEETERTLASSKRSDQSQAGEPVQLSAKIYLMADEETKYESVSQQVAEEEEERRDRHQIHLLQQSIACNAFAVEQPQEQSKPVKQNNEINMHCSDQQNTLSDIGNIKKEPKTKKYLQQFKKTFNKCLNTKYYKMKSPATSPAASPTLCKTSPLPMKRQNCTRLINQMLKGLDKNNKFATGHRKLQLRYEGERRDGVREGTGIVYYSNGMCYEGSFKDNLRHGVGTLRLNTVEIYHGEWAADEMVGRGRIKNCVMVNRHKQTSAQSKLSKWVAYVGQFNHNRFEGEGTLHLQGGEKFVGKFICGLACGEGNLFKKNGEVETGVWRNNVLYEQF